MQLAVAIGAQWMQRSVLDNGLAVLSLAAGPVLGAFLVGVLNRTVGTRAMMTGILTGIVVLFVVWWNSLVAWTWYAFVGAAVTGAHGDRGEPVDGQRPRAKGPRTRRLVSAPSTQHQSIAAPSTPAPSTLGLWP